MSVTTKNFRSKRYSYQNPNPGYENYIKMVNSPRGIVKDDVTKAVLRECGFEFNDDEHAQSKYDVSSLWDAFFNYDRKRWHNPNKEIFHEAVSRVKSRFKQLDGTLYQMHESEVMRALKWQASAGSTSFTSKAEAMKDWEGLNVERAAKFPCVAYFRTQARMNESGQWKQKVRLVWGYPLDMTILEGKYARPAINALVINNSPYLLGKGNGGIGARVNHIMWKTYVGSFDWSSFDASVSKELIFTAFSIVKNWFKPGQINEEEWKQLVRYFVYTPILMPDRKVYFGKDGGIPSGSYFTGIIGSICNLLLIEYLLLEQDNITAKDDILVMGDDSLVGLMYNLDLEWMSDSASSCFGMNLHPEKQRFSSNSRETEFLSHQWRNGRWSRPIEVTAVKAVYSENSWSVSETDGDVEAYRLARLTSIMYADNHKAWPYLRATLRARGVFGPPRSRWTDDESKGKFITDKVVDCDFAFKTLTWKKEDEFCNRGTLRTQWLSILGFKG